MDVIANFPGTQLPEDGTKPHYIVGPDGMYLRKKLPWVDATVKLRRATMLDPVSVDVKLTTSPLSGEVLAAAVAFFREVCTRYNGSEAAVLIHYHPEKGWDYTVPKQAANPQCVIYDTNQERGDGFACVGTIHSHGRATAYHSPTDHADESVLDGIHLTVGHTHAKGGFSLSGEVVVNNNRFPYEDLWHIPGLKRVPELKVPRTFMGTNRIPGCNFYTLDGGIQYRPVTDEEFARIAYEPNLSSHSKHAFRLEAEEVVA